MHIRVNIRYSYSNLIFQGDYDEDSDSENENGADRGKECVFVHNKVVRNIKS